MDRLTDLFSDSISGLNYVPLNGAFGKLTEKNMEGRGHGLMAPALASRDRKIVKSLRRVNILVMIWGRQQKKKKVRSISINHFAWFECSALVGQGRHSL
jgi:hypothetical protein